MVEQKFSWEGVGAEKQVLGLEFLWGSWAWYPGKFLNLGVPKC